MLSETQAMQRNATDLRPQDTRRKFLKSAGALAAGLAVARASRPVHAELLAIAGGPKAVTYP